MRRIIILLFVLLSSLSVLGQQEAMYSQYMFNKLAINPAYAGSRDSFFATALFRTQWVGIKGAPETKTISLDGSFHNRKLGLGVQVFNYNIGITNLNGGSLTYAYRIFMENSTLAFGLQGGATHIKADLNSVNLEDPNPDQAFLQNIDQVLLNFGAGIYYNTERFYFGLSTPHLLRNRFNLNSDGNTNDLSSRQYLHLFINSGYIFDLDEDLKIKPSILFYGIQGSPIQIDINTNLYIKDLLSAGLQYRTTGAVALMAEVQITPKVRMGYFYDKSTTKLVRFSSGSHEIMLRYEFGSEKGKVISQKYF